MDSQLLHDLKSLLGPDARPPPARRPDALRIRWLRRNRAPRLRRLPAHHRRRRRPSSKLANQYQTPLVGRGAGTGLSGGALARKGGILTVFSRMNRILEIDVENQRATVQPGVVNPDLSAPSPMLGLSFRARSFQPESLHHRRQRFRKFRRPAHARLRRHHQSRLSARSGSARRRTVFRIGSYALDSPGYDLPRTFCRLRRHARTGHRNHRETLAQIPKP